MNAMKRTPQRVPAAPRSDSPPAGSSACDREDGAPPNAAELPGAIHGADYAGSTPASVDSVSYPRLPPFWRAKPDLWFLQVEATFRRSRVRLEDSKYDMVVAMLDPETLQDIEDVIRAPSTTGRYSHLKEALLARLTDSADQQLLRLFAKLELGERKPSQLLRHMRALAGERVSNDVLRIKWLDLLPTSTQRLLRILKTSGLDELAAVADELVDSHPMIAAASCDRSPALCAEPPEARATPDSATLAQILSLNRRILEELRRRPVARNRSGGNSCRRARSPASGTSDGICHWHRRWGDLARNCAKPCSFQAKPRQGN